MDDETIKALFGTDSMPPLPLFLLSSGGAAVAVIALCVRAAEARPGALWIAPLAAMGQMALTWYVFHILFGLGTVVALGLATREPLPVGQACGLLFFSAAVLISWLWKRRFPQWPARMGHAPARRLNPSCTGSDRHVNLHRGRA